MARTYKTPGVYIEEIPKFPPSVAQVETAIPAFIGYTEKADIVGMDYHAENIIRAVKVKSLPEYELYFGEAPEPTTLEMVLNNDNTVKSVVANGINLIYDSVRMFYANGGGDCFIVSVGGHNTTAEDIDKDILLAGISSLEKVDLPTLLVVPETVHLSDVESGEVHALMLSQCNKLQDRFAVLDIKDGNKEITPVLDPIEIFRTNVGLNNLKYGAAYYPWIETTLPFEITYNSVLAGNYRRPDNSAIADVSTLFHTEVVELITAINSDVGSKSTLTVPQNTPMNDRNDLVSYATELFTYLKDFKDLTFNDNRAADTNSGTNIHGRYIAENSNFHNLLKTFYDYVHFSDGDNSSANLAAAWNDTILDLTAGGNFNPGEQFAPLTFNLPGNPSNDIYQDSGTATNAAPFFTALTGKITALIDEFFSELENRLENQIGTLSEIDPVYQGILSAIKEKGVTLPPSGAVVGLYAAVDNARGVWKAPANVSLTAIKSLSVSITHEDQEDLNVDTIAGKSINAIRSFTGKGTLVWGARTLAGNDNEWRYISVRRFFNMVEESVKKATSQFVFEPNDANTWVKVRSMIENFLTLQWRAGALQGAKPEQAFYVKVGLGQTMTAQDILNGFMNVEIGMAVVRPAEFIILKFSHKLPES